MRFRCLISLGLLAYFAPSSLCSGASLNELNLVPDGSAKPPGDRIDFTIQFAPDENEIEIKVRGFIVSGEQNEVVTPVKGGSDHGELAQKRIARDSDSLVKRGSIVIPYSSLVLPKGTHQIAYELTGASKDQLSFVRPTSLTKVVITGETRNKIKVAETKLNNRTEERSLKALIAGPRMRGQPPKTVVKEMLMQTPIVESTTESQTVSVEIPGEFIRSEILPAGSQTTKTGIEATDAESLSGQTWQPLNELKSDQERRIWFATNRMPSKNNSTQFTAAVAKKVQFGSCVVSIPIQKHRKGNLEAPKWWSKRNPELHFVINGVQTFDTAAFKKHFGEGDVLLFVHGFYNTFQDAIYRTSQLHHDLDFAGQSLAFSWPSAGEISKYAEDQVNADASVDALVEVIRTVASSMKPSGDSQPKIHIIAHSMGNRVLLQSLYKINDTTSTENPAPPIGQIVLAAPDVGAIMFNNLSSYVVDLCEQVTYYYCESDAALNTSRELNKYEPVGLLPYFGRGLTTIDANGVGTSFIGHGYYASSRQVLSDVELMLKYGKAPSQRMPPLANETKVFGHKCWSFIETKAVAVADDSR